MNGQVYILKVEGQDAYKIGITSGKISDRIAALQTGNPNKIRHIFHAQVENEANLERFLHGHFKAQKMQGEWYKLDANQLAEAIRLIQHLQNEYALKLAIDNKANLSAQLKTTKTARETTETYDRNDPGEYLQYLPREEILLQLLENTILDLVCFVHTDLNIKEEAKADRAVRSIVYFIVDFCERADLRKKFRVDEFLENPKNWGIMS